MALYIPHSILNLARLLYVRPETFGPYYVYFLPSGPYFSSVKSEWKVKTFTYFRFLVPSFEDVKNSPNLYKF